MGNEHLERIVDAKRAHELIPVWKASGQSIAAFCRDRRIALWTFHKWRQQLDALPAVVEVRVATVEPRPARSYDVVLPSGIAIRLDDAFSEDTLVRLIAAARRAC